MLNTPGRLHMGSLHPTFPSHSYQVSGMAQHKHQLLHFSVLAKRTYLIHAAIWAESTVNSASTIKHFICSVYLLYIHMGVCVCVCSVIDMCLFLHLVINIYLINSKDRICGTKTIIFMNASSEYVKIQKKCFIFGVSGNMRRKSCQLLTSFFSSALIFFLPQSSSRIPHSHQVNAFFTHWDFAPPPLPGHEWVAWKGPPEFCSGATGLG